MSAPLRPLASLPASRQPSSLGPSNLGQSTAESSSASSSVHAGAQPNRSDQVLYRFYLKTVAVLGEGRLTHCGNGSKADKKKDKWVRSTEDHNLTPVQPYFAGI